MTPSLGSENSEAIFKISDLNFVGKPGELMHVLFQTKAIPVYWPKYA